MKTQSAPHVEDLAASAASATWKFDFLDTVSADPKANGECLGVIKAYLNYAAKSKPYAFCSLDELVLRTGSSKPAVRRAKTKLISLGYLAVKYVTGDRCTVYELANVRKQVIDDHLRIAREVLAEQKRERKRVERRRGG